MKKEDIKTLIVFIILIIAIISVLGINLYKNRKLENVDRKIKYIMGYSYDTIYNKGSNLFLQTISLLNDKDVFEYAKNNDGSIKKYAIENINDYIKINNFSIALNTFTDSSLKEYMNKKDIIYFEDNYYMKDYINESNNYIGSIIDIDTYDNSKITFKSINYYCDNTKYIGLLEDIPECNYTFNETKFNIVLENNMFKIEDIKDFEFISK